LYFCKSVFAMKIATDADMPLNKTILYCTKHGPVDFVLHSSL